MAVPIEGGVGSFSTYTLPTLGMSLNGCVTVLEAHSGSWHIRAHERVADHVLEVEVEPGVGRMFSHTFGMRAKIDFEFRWSEPRDTTLVLWVGVDFGSEPEGGTCSGGAPPQGVR